MIALFGASGASGKSISMALRAQGLRYRVVGRSLKTLQAEFGSDPLAELKTWDPNDPESVREAARGVETMIYLVGVPYTNFELHPILLRKALDGAIAEKVSKFVLIGTVYPYGRARAERVKEDHPREPHTFKGKMRKEQEDLVLEADRAGKIRATVLRLPDFYGPGVTMSYLHSIFEAAKKGSRAMVIGPLDRPREFVFVPDIGPIVLRLEKEPRAYGRVWHYGGPGVITQRELIQKAFAVTGRKPKYLVFGKTLLRVFGVFVPFMREIAEMDYLMTDPVVMDDSALRGLLGDLPKTSYDEGIRRSVL